MLRWHIRVAPRLSPRRGIGRRSSTPDRGLLSSLAQGDAACRNRGRAAAEGIALGVRCHYSSRRADRWHSRTHPSGATHEDGDLRPSDTRHARSLVAGGECVRRQLADLARAVQYGRVERSAAAPVVERYREHRVASAPDRCRRVVACRMGRPRVRHVSGRKRGQPGGPPARAGQRCLPNGARAGKRRDSLAGSEIPRRGVRLRGRSNSRRRATSPRSTKSTTSRVRARSSTGSGCTRYLVQDRSSRWT
jgi:hypothetical protein